MEGLPMATLQQKIVDTFLHELAGREDFPAEKVEQLRTLLASGKKLKAEEFAAIFSLPAGGDLS
jgi:hypothetical protein